MPSADDLSEQLNITQKLAAQVERMAAAAEKLEQSYSQQVDTLQKVAQALGQLDVQGSVQNVEGLKKALINMIAKLNDTGKAGEANFKKLGKRVEDAGKLFNSKFMKPVVIATAALTGFYQGLRNVVSLGKSLTGFFGSFLDGVVNVTAAILAIPFKIFEGLVDMAAKNASAFTELAQAIEDLRKEFGALNGPTNKAIIDTTKSMKGFSDTGLSTWRVFGMVWDRLKYMRELVADMGASFSKLREEFEEAGGAILGFQKGLGLTGEDMKAVTMRSVSMGQKTTHNLRDMTKYSYELGDAFELDAKLISRDMARAMADVGHFGGSTVKQIAEASTYARKLGLELKDITGTLDAFDTFDTAAENAAKLSQALGVQVDAFEMMSAQSPAEQLDMLRKSFARAGVDASNFNRAQLKLVSSTTGLDEATVQSALSMKNQGASLDQVQKKGSEAQKKTLTQAEAMQKLADAIERMVFAGGSMHGGFWDTFLEGVKNGIFSSREFYGLMFKIQRALYQVYMIGVKLGRALVEIVPGLKDIGEGLNKFFDPKHFTKFFTDISDVVKRYFSTDSKYKEFKGNVPGLVAGLSKSVKDFFTAEGPHGRAILEGFKKFFKFLSKFAADGIKLVGQAISQGAKTIVKMLKGEAPIPGASGAKGVVQGGLGFLQEVLEPMIQSLKEAWKVVAPALWELVLTVSDKLVQFLKDKRVLDKVKPALGGLAVVLFGPAFTRAILAALTASLAKSAASALGGGIKRALGGLVSKAVDVEEAAHKATKGAENMDKVTAVNRATGEAVKAGKGWGVQDAFALGAKLVAIATALSIGGIEMAVAVMGMKKILDRAGIKETKDVVPVLEVLGGMVLASLPLIAAVSLASKVGVSLQNIVVGGAAVATVVGVMGTVGAGLAWLMSKVSKPDQLRSAGGFMRDMSVVFLAMVPLIAGAGLLGAAILATGGTALLAVGVGMATLTGAVAAVAATAMAVVKALSTLEVGPDFQPKINAFLDVMKVIQTFSATMVNMLSLMTPTFTELLSGTATSFKGKVNAASKLIREMIGRRGAGFGIIGVVEAVQDALRDMSFNADIAQKAQTFASIMEAVASALKAMTPPPEFYAAGSSFLNRLTDPTYDFASLAHNVGQYVKSMREQLMALLNGEGGTGGLIGVINSLSAVKVDKDAAASAGQLLSAIASVLQSIMPSDATLKAFQTVSESSGLWGVVKSSVSKLDVDAIKTYFETVGKQLQTIIPTLTSSVLSGMLQQAEGLTPDKMKGLEAVTGVLKTTTDLLNSAMSVSKQVPAEGVDLGGISRLNDAFPKLADDLSELSKTVATATQADSDLRGFQKNMTAFANMLRGDENSKSGITGALVAVSEMVKQTNALNDALGGFNKIDIKAKLGQVANAVGLGGKATYTVNPSKQVQVVVNLEVTMDVGEVEKVMILRKQSIIGDRLDFATIRNPGAPLAGPELTSLSPANPPTVPATSSATGGR